MSECKKCYWHPDGILKGISLERLVEIGNAERDGRCVVLSTQMLPLMVSDEEMDSDVYCPACKETLSGGWPKYYADQEGVMCQCFHCGQSIDDTKTFTRAEAEAAFGKEAQHEGDRDRDRESD